MMLHIWILYGEDLFSMGIYRLIQTKIYIHCVYFHVCEIQRTRMHVTDITATPYGHQMAVATWDRSINTRDDSPNVTKQRNWCVRHECHPPDRIYYISRAPTKHAPQKKIYWNGWPPRSDMLSIGTWDVSCAIKLHMNKSVWREAICRRASQNCHWNNNISCKYKYCYKISISPHICYWCKSARNKSQSSIS